MYLSKRQYRTVALFALLIASVIPVMAQSGRSGLRGYVAFEDLSWNDVAERKVRAKVELLHDAKDKNPVMVETSEHGSFDFQTVAPGEYILRITSPGYRVYQTEIYLPSDFIGNVGVMLKKEKH